MKLKVFPIIITFLVSAGMAAPALALAPRSAVPAFEYTPDVQVFPGGEALAAACARKMADEVAAHNHSGSPTVLGLATGSTPLLTYRKLIEICRAEKIDLSLLITFNLDEYRGLPPGHPERYDEFMRKNLILDLVPLGFKLENFHILNGWAKKMTDLTDEERAQIDARFPLRESNERLNEAEELFILNLRCREYEARIEKLGPVDLQILGIGENGHIGFAEPGAPWNGRTGVVELTEQTRRANARFFNNDLAQVPRHALSMGVGTILQARRILLLATGEKKAEAIEKTLLGPLTPQVPASALRRHPRAEFLLDSDAAALFAKAAPQVREKEEPVLGHWLELWLAANGIRGPFVMKHEVNQKPDSRGVFKTYGRLSLGKKTPFGIKTLTIFEYHAEPQWELGVTQQKTRKAALKRKRLITLLYVYFLHQLQTPSVYNYTISEDGLVLLAGLEKLGILKEVTKFGVDPKNAHAEAQLAHVHQLAADPARIFKTAPPVLAEISL